MLAQTDLKRGSVQDTGPAPQLMKKVVGKPYVDRNGNYVIPADMVRYWGNRLKNHPAGHFKISKCPGHPLLQIFKRYNSHLAPGHLGGTLPPYRENRSVPVKCPARHP
jgi:hypothetical protein